MDNWQRIGLFKLSDIGLPNRSTANADGSPEDIPPVSEQNEPSKDSSANVTEETKAHRIVRKLLKSDNIEGLQKALEKKPPKEQEAVVESTVLAFQNLNRFFESVNKALLSQHKDAINSKIVRLQAIV